jgi:hypothetical protein
MVVSQKGGAIWARRNRGLFSRDDGWMFEDNLDLLSQEEFSRVGIPKEPRFLIYTRTVRSRIMNGAHSIEATSA